MYYRAALEEAGKPEVLLVEPLFPSPRGRKEVSIIRRHDVLQTQNVCPTGVEGLSLLVGHDSGSRKYRASSKLYTLITETAILVYGVCQES